MYDEKEGQCQGMVMLYFFGPEPLTAEDIQDRPGAEESRSLSPMLSESQQYGPQDVVFSMIFSIWVWKEASIQVLPLQRVLPASAHARINASFGPLALTSDDRDIE